MDLIQAIRLTIGLSAWTRTVDTSRHAESEINEAISEAAGLYKLAPARGSDGPTDTVYLALPAEFAGQERTYAMTVLDCRGPVDQGTMRLTVRGNRFCVGINYLITAILLTTYVWTARGNNWAWDPCSTLFFGLLVLGLAFTCCTVWALLTVSTTNRLLDAGKAIAFRLEST